MGNEGLIAVALALAVLVVPRSAGAEGSAPGPLAAPAPPDAADAPSSPRPGLVLLVLGGLAVGAGAVDLGTAPLCELRTIRASARPACLVTSLVSGGALLAAGIPMLVVGARQRSAPSIPAGVAPTTGGAMLVWTGKF